MRASMMLFPALLAALALCGCSDDDEGGPDAGADTGVIDTGGGDTGDTDGTQPDGAGDAESCTVLDQDVTTDTTLQGCYIVAEKISVTAGALLTIEPPSVLTFRTGTWLHVASDGALKAVGSASDPILFTGENKSRGSWAGIEFHNSASNDNLLKHVIIEYGGGYEWPYGERANVALTSSGYPVKASIENAVLRESAGYGFFLDIDSEVPSFAANTVTKSSAGAGLVEDDAARFLDSGSAYTGNDTDAVLIKADALHTAQTWQALDVPYHVDGVLHIDGPTLTVAAGATLKFWPGSGIEVGSSGALAAKGTASAKVTFTWGVTGSEWRGIQLLNSDSTDNVIEHAVVEHGGSYKFPYGDKANIALTSSGFATRLTLTNSTVRDSVGYGVWVANTGALTESGNTFSGNALSPDIFQQP